MRQLKWRIFLLRNRIFDLEGRVERFQLLYYLYRKLRLSKTVRTTLELLITKSPSFPRLGVLCTTPKVFKCTAELYRVDWQMFFVTSRRPIFSTQSVNFNFFKIHSEFFFFFIIDSTLSKWVFFFYHFEFQWIFSKITVTFLTVSAKEDSLTEGYLCKKKDPIQIVYSFKINLFFDVDKVIDDQLLQ